MVTSKKQIDELSDTENNSNESIPTNQFQRINSNESIPINDYNLIDDKQGLNTNPNLDSDSANQFNDVVGSNLEDADEMIINSYHLNTAVEENREANFDTNPEEEEEQDKEKEDANLEEYPQRDQTRERQKPNSMNIYEVILLFNFNN